MTTKQHNHTTRRGQHPPHDSDTRYAGPPCKHGHAGIRYVINSQCVECDRLRHRNTDPSRLTWKQRNPSAVRDQRQRYRARRAALMTHGNAGPAVYRTGEPPSPGAAYLSLPNSEVATADLRRTRGLVTLTGARLKSLYQASLFQGGRVSRVSARAAIDLLHRQAYRCDECMGAHPLRLAFIQHPKQHGHQLANLHWVCPDCDTCIGTLDDL